MPWMRVPRPHPVLSKLICHKTFTPVVWTTDLKKKNAWGLKAEKYGKREKKKSLEFIILDKVWSFGINISSDGFSFVATPLWLSKVTNV